VVSGGGKQAREAEPRWPNYVVGEVLMGSSTARTGGSKEAPEITA
jgi:cobalamin biosynthesis Mg chelatase CobN